MPVTQGASRPLRAVVAVLVVVVGTLTFGAIPARAACPDQNYNTVGAPGGSEWLGVRVSGPGMDIFDGNVSCARVSSLFVLNSTGTRFVELGWHEAPSRVYYCIPLTTGSPKTLAYSYDNGNRDCKTSSADLNEGTQGFYIQDQNTDGVWKFFREGNQIWTSPDMTPFSSGTLQNNGERLDFSNTSHAVFDGLDRLRPNGTWENWDSTNEHAWSDDPQAHFCKYSNTHTQVKLNGTAC